jgi:hypothetical protein
MRPMPETKGRPQKAKPAISGFSNLVAGVGFEPTTFGL